MLRPLALGLTLALLASAAHATETTLGDAETTTGWDNATLINEAKAGQHAIRIPVPAGQAGGGALSLRGAKLDFSQNGTIRFWYRLNGTGETNLLFKLISPTFNNNIQSVWEVASVQKADGQWHQVTVDLASPYMKWGNAPETGNQYLYFRTNAPAGSNLTLDIDDVVFTPGEVKPVVAAPKLTPGTKIQLSDAESTSGWDTAKLIDDAKIGQHAVRFAVPAGSAGAVTLNLSRTEADFSRGGELTFWYRFSGTGSSNLMIKAQQYPFADGYQAVWEVAPKGSADGQWHLATIDLTSTYARWGNAPDKNSKYLLFRTDATPGSSLTLDLDEVAVRAPLYSAKAQRAIVQDKTLRAGIDLTNATDKPLTVDAAGTKVTLPPGANQLVNANVPLNPETLAKLQPLHTATQTLRLTANGDPSTLKELTVTFSAPVQLPPHPRLFLTNAEIPGVKARIAVHPPLKATYDSILKVADGYVTRPTNLPDRGGQWWHYYACKKDGARLQTVSPTQHKCPVCGTIYSGWPYDDVVLSNVHTGYSKAVLYLGFAYRLTGERKYADKAREILLAYAEKYLTYPEHDFNNKPGPNGGRVDCQKLGEAIWLIPVVQGTDLIWEALSETDRQTLEDKLFRPAVAEVRSQRMGIHNIQNWQNSAVGLTGLLINEPEFLSDALNSEFGFRNQIAKGITAEGQWDEGSWGYHFYAMNGMVPLLEAGERCGLNLYAYEANGHSFKTMFEAPLQLAMPNYDLPAFNDSNPTNLLTESNLWEGGQGSLYELALTRYKEPQFAAILSQLKRGSIEALLAGTFPLPSATAEAVQSRNYPGAGYAVMQHGTGKDAAWLCLKYGPHGGGHGHFDKLGFISYNHGQTLAYDPGTASYGVPIQEEWYRTSLAHNTLTVDETNQKPATGQCLAFLNQGDTTAALLDAGPIYDGVRYRRALAMFGSDTIILLDLADSATEHTYDFAYHNAGQWSTAPTGTPITLPAKPGYQHLKDMVETTAVPAITTGPVTTQIAVAALQKPQILAGTGVGTNAASRVPCLVTRVRGPKAAVATIIHQGSGEPKVNLQETPNGYTVTGEVDGKTYKLNVMPEAEVKLGF